MCFEQMEINTSHVVTSVSRLGATSSTGFAEAHRQDETQRLEVCARSMLRDCRSEGPRESPEGVIFRSASAR